MVFRWQTPIKPHEPGFIPMREAMRKAIIKQETNPKAVAEKLGLNRFYVYNYLTGEKNEVEAEKAAQVLKHLKLPLELLTGDRPPKRRKPVAVEQGPVMLVGTVETGAWREPMKEQPSGLPPAPGFPASDQRAFLVSGSDMTKLADPGDHLLVLTREPPIIEGAYVVLKKLRAGLVEYGLYQAHIGEQLELWPVARASKGMFAPVLMPLDKPQDVVGVVIRVVKKSPGG